MMCGDPNRDAEARRDAAVLWAVLAVPGVLQGGPHLPDCLPPELMRWVGEADHAALRSLLVEVVHRMVDDQSAAESVD